MANAFIVDANTVALWHFDGSLASAAKKDNAEGTSGYDIASEINGITSGNGKFQVTDGAYLFNEVNKTALKSSSCPSIPTSFTLEAWVYPVSFTADCYIFGLFATTEYDMVSIALQTSGKPYGNYYRPSSTVNSTNCLAASAISLNQWSYIAYLHNAATDIDEIYINGVLSTQLTGKTADPWQPGGSPSTFVFGHHPNTTGRYNGFDGYIDECRYSNIARSAAEIAAIWASINETYMNRSPLRGVSRGIMRP